MQYTDFLKQANYIDGQWVGADSGDVIEVTNPATGSVLGTGAQVWQVGDRTRD